MLARTASPSSLRRSDAPALRGLAWIGWVAVLVLAGCPAPRQPWAGQTYQPPGARPSAGRTTYTPTPRILPSIRMPTVNQADEDAAIERMLGLDPTEGSADPLAGDQ